MGRRPAATCARGHDQRAYRRRGPSGYTYCTKCNVERNRERYRLSQARRVAEMRRLLRDGLALPVDGEQAAGWQRRVFLFFEEAERASA